MAEFVDYLSEKYKPESIDEVNRRLLELESLFEISQLLNESLELSSILNNVLYIPMGRLMIARSAIILRINGEERVVMAKGISTELQNTKMKISEFPRKPFELNDHSSEAAREENADLISFAISAKLEIVIPLSCKNNVVGLMLFGAKLNKNAFGPEEIDFLASLANLSATAIENALHMEQIQKINSRLDRKVHELKTLFDIGQGLSSTLDYSQILRLLVYALMGQMLITRYAILLKNDSGLTAYEVKGMPDELVENICKQIQPMKPTAAATLTTAIPRKRLSRLFQQGDMEVLIPMQHQDKLIGYILLGSKISQDSYSSADLEFLTTLVSQAVTSLENARLFEETLEKQRMEEELNVARNIQKGLLPKQIPEIPGYEVFGMNTSSKQVGGDYYDIIPIDENLIAFAIGDVSGKGIPASLLMANLQSALRVMVKPGVNLAEAVAQLNTLIHANTGLDKFITFFVGILDLKTHRFDYVNAGHNNPIFFCSNQEMKFLDVGGIILGIMPGYSYQTGSIQFDKGEFILTYTDGVNEAINPHDEEFGEESLYDLVAKNCDRTMNELVDSIWQAIDQFSEGQPQADDVTMLAFRRLA